MDVLGACDLHTEIL